MKDKKLVLLIGEANSNNLGDSVICNVGYALFSKIYNSNVALFDISIVKRLLYRHNLCRKVLDKARLYKLFEYYYILFVLLFKYRKTGKVIFVGGALIKDYFINAINPILRFACLRGIPVRFLSIGYEKLSEEDLKSFIRHVECVDDLIISTRDNREYLEIIFGKEIKNTPDIALLSSRIYKNKHVEPNLIGLGCINPEAYKWKDKHPEISNNYIEDMVQTIEKLCSLGYKVELFTNGDLKDYECAQKVIRQSGNKNVQLAIRPLTDVDLVDCITKYEKIISARLHSLIIAFSYGIPAYCIGWSHKVYDFAEMTGNTNVIDMAEINSVEWISKVTNIEINEPLRVQLIDDVLSFIKKL